jgi:DNA modification methylase
VIMWNPRSGQAWALKNWVSGTGAVAKNRARSRASSIKGVCQKCGAVRIDQQLGLEKTPGEFIQTMVIVFQEVRRILRADGTLWLNLGDSYAANRSYQVEQTKGGPKHGPAQAVSGRGQKAADYGLKQKDMVGIPWRVALALQDDGWYLRQDIIWHKPNPMPESCRDRCTKAHEYLFLLSKSARYHYDQDAIRETVGPSGWDTEKGSHENYHKAGRGQTRYTFARKTATQGVPGAPDQHREDREPKFYQGTRNKRSVWTVATHPYKGAHFATFPPKLIEPCILAGCPRGGTVLDPFGGSGTTAFVANAYGRKAILCELNPANVPLIRERLGIGYETQPAETEMDLFKQVV